MSEEQPVQQPAQGVGPWIKKHVPSKKLRAAHRRYLKAGGEHTLKAWASNGSGRKSLAEEWLRNKKAS